MPTFRIHHRVDAYDVYDVDAPSPGEAIAALRDNPGRHRVSTVSRVRIDNTPVDTNTVVAVNAVDEDGTRVNITTSALLSFYLLDRAPKKNLVVCSNQENTRDSVLNMAATLLAAGHPNAAGRVAEFVDSENEHPALALLRLDEHDTIWRSQEAFALAMTLHDMLNEVAPEDTFFGTHPESKDLGFWEVQYP